MSDREEGRMSRRLRSIISDLEKVKNTGDEEEWHFEADALLCEAVRTLAAYTTDTPDEGDVEELLRVYEAIPKWYA